MSLEDDLAAFTGTSRYYRHPLGVLYTDGVRHLAEAAGAYWLIDLVANYQPKVESAGFQLWKLRTRSDRTGLATMLEDDGQPSLVRQELEYTDFPLPEFSFYIIDGVVLLKSEY